MKPTILLILLCISCAKSFSPSKELSRAELLMNDYPDSALTILNNMPTDNLSRKETARHALLLSMALDKNYYDVASDSILQPAISYYSLHGKSRDRMLTHYYEAIIRKNAEEYPLAVVALEKAEKEAFKLSDYHHLGLIYRNKASIFSLCNNLSSAIECRKRAISYFTLAKEDSYLTFALFSLAADYKLNDDYDNALKVIRPLLDSTQYQSIIHRGHLLEASILAEQGMDIDMVQELYGSVPIYYYSFQDCGYRAAAYEETGQRDSSAFWMDYALSLAKDEADSASIDYMRSHILFHRNDIHEAYLLLDHATRVQDSLTRVLLKESVSGAQRDYFKEDALRQEELSERRRIWIAVISVTAVLLLAIGHALYRLRTEKKNQQLKDLMGELAVSNKSIVQLYVDNASLLGRLFDERLSRLNSLSKDYFNTDEAKQKELVFNRFKDYVRDLRKNDDLFIKLEDDLNRFCDNAVKKVRTQIPSIKGDKLKILMLFFAQLPYQAIVLIMNGTTVDNLKMTRSRLRKDIIKAQSSDETYLLELLKNPK